MAVPFLPTANAQEDANWRKTNAETASVESPSWKTPSGAFSPTQSSGRPLSATDLNRRVGESQVKPIFWNKSDFLIPFNVGNQGKLPEAVELEVSTDDGMNWITVERSNIQDRQFTFRSNGDGLYWFRIKTVDNEGKSFVPNSPPLAIVIDTNQPQIDLVVDTDAQARMVADYRIADANLSAIDMRLEYQTELDPSWIPVQMQTQFGRNSMELVGRATWDVNIRAKQMMVRLIVKDLAGNESEITRMPSLMRTADSGAGLKLASSGSGFFDKIFPSTENATNPNASPTFATQAIPRPSTANQSSQRTHLTSGPEVLPTPPMVHNTQPFGKESVETKLTIEPGDASASNQRYTFQKVDPTQIQPTPANMNPQSAGTTNITSDIPPRQPNSFASNSRAFSLDYNVDVDNYNQVADIELWATTDAGRTWNQWGKDPDRTSPFDIRVQNDGLFGFRMVIVGTNGLANHRPIPGDDADAWIQVDTQKPTARIVSAQYGQGQEAGQLIIEYTANDEFLAERPILLSYSQTPEGPWTTIEAEIPNTGRFAWKGNPNLPRRVYLKIEAYDRAGNVFTDRMELPVDLEGLAPRGRIQGFRPIPQ